MSCESSSELASRDKDNLSSDKTLPPEEMLGEAHHSNQLQEHSLESIIANGSGEDFERAVPCIGKEIRRGEDLKLIGNKMLHYRLMQLYYRVYKEIESKEGQQEYILFLLSLLAEILRHNCNIRLPFSKKTVLSLLSFDGEKLLQTKECSQIILILAVLFENMAKQGRLMVRLGVEQQLKQGLLLLIGKADEYSALRISLRALLELQAKTKMGIAPRELEEAGIIEKVLNAFGQGAATKIRSLVCRPSVRKIQTISKMTLLELISNK